jgi:sec-independent protein translocase protein TatA
MGLDNPIHIAFLLIMLLVVFGAKRLPEMGHSLGTGMRGFKDALSGESSEPSLSAVQATKQEAPQAPIAVTVPVPVQTPLAVPVGVDETRSVA